MSWASVSTVTETAPPKGKLAPLVKGLQKGLKKCVPKKASEHIKATRVDSKLPADAHMTDSQKAFGWFLTEAGVARFYLGEERFAELYLYPTYAQKEKMSRRKAPPPQPTLPRMSSGEELWLLFDRKYNSSSL